MKRLAKKVLLVGWDAADWKFLTPLMEAGKMPTLTKLVEGGVNGRLATLDPPLSPTLWTSIATGKRPYKHGIHGFTEPDPSGKGIRPIYITNRKAMAIWNILTQRGLKSNVVGWWPSHPAEPVNGVMISNFFQRANAPLGKPWPLAKGTIHPPELIETLAKLRVHPGELMTGAFIQPFVPEAWKIDRKSDKRLDRITSITADCSTLHCATTWLMENTEWDLTAGYLDAIDHYCHGFMKYHPPRRAHIPKKDYELYKDVVNAGCQYHDMMLERLLELAGEDTTVILISDHGFHPDHNRPKVIPREPAGPAAEHSSFGIIVMNGPGIKKDELIFGASLLDITPTLLTLFGLPVAEDMDGKVLMNAFEEPPEIETIRSWENLNPDSDRGDGTHPSETTQSAEEMQAELQQLIDLGYVEDPGDDMDAAIKKTRDENDFYLARAYLNGGEWDEGIQLLEQLHEDNPETTRYAVRLANAYQSVGKYKAARKTVEHIRKVYDRESPHLDILEGTLLLTEQRFKKALDLFKKAEAEAGDLPNIHLRLANAYLQLNKLEEAEIALQKELKTDPEEVSAWHALGITFYRMGRYEEAAEAFMEAIGLMYYFPLAHYHLGETLMEMERYEDAVNAFEVCLKITPNFNSARQKLINIHEQFLKQPGKAFKYKTDFENKIQGEIIVVSGLPRSGTSMMMQMLEAGGIEIFTDKERTADESNPKGYYEHEAVKNLAKNNKWIPDAKDKAMKVIAQLLQYLPMNFRYKVIFMERNIYEVLQSQQKMLSENGKRAETNALPLPLLESYKKTLKKAKEWGVNQPNVEMLFLSHREVIENPFTAAMKVHDFLDKDLKPEKMAAKVERKLYRERVEKTTAV